MADLSEFNFNWTISWFVKSRFLILIYHNLQNHVVKKENWLFTICENYILFKNRDKLNKRVFRAIFLTQITVTYIMNFIWITSKRQETLLAGFLQCSQIHRFRLWPRNGPWSKNSILKLSKAYSLSSVLLRFFVKSCIAS